MPAKVRRDMIPGGVRETYPSGIVQEVFDPPKPNGLANVTILPNGDRTEIYADGTVKAYSKVKENDNDR